MANSPAPSATLRPGDLALLRAAATGTTEVPGVRARIVLLAAEGHANTRIAALCGVSRPTVIGWRRRYAEDGFDGLRDGVRRGREPRIEVRQVITATLEAPPRRHATTHWSARLLGEQLGVGRSTVSRAWQAYGVRPRGAGTFRFDVEPELVAYVTDLVGLALSPRGCIAVLSTYDASGRALSRHAGRDTELASGLAPIAAYAALRAALDSPDQHARAGNPDLGSFLDRARDAHPPYGRRRPELSLVVHGDRPAAALEAWSALNKPSRVHLAASRERWLNLLEAFLTLVELPATRRGAVGCVPELDELTRQVAEGRSPLRTPFMWTAEHAAARS